jgi:hypothetical protein
MRFEIGCRRRRGPSRANRKPRAFAQGSSCLLLYLCSLSVALLHHSAVRVRFAGLVQVLDACLVDQHTIAPGAQLYDALVIPLDDAVDLLAVFEHHRHLGLLLHLFLEIECLGMRAFGCSVDVGNHRVGQRIFRVHGVAAALRGRRQMRSDELARSVERIVFSAGCALALNHFVYLFEVTLKQIGDKGPGSTLAPCEKPPKQEPNSRCLLGLDAKSMALD